MAIRISSTAPATGRGPLAHTSTSTTGAATTHSRILQFTIRRIIITTGSASSTRTWTTTWMPYGPGCTTLPTLIRGCGGMTEISRLAILHLRGALRRGFPAPAIMEWADIMRTSTKTETSISSSICPTAGGPKKSTQFTATMPFRTEQTGLESILSRVSLRQTV